MNTDLQAYLENMQKPWGMLFYKMIWDQLSFVKGLKVLDFGSGFGFTANYFAENNQVVAIEPNNEMVINRKQDNKYQQIIGNYEKLREMTPGTFDVIICHNVFEYASEREDIIKEFYRILKPKGKLSIVKHNHAGRIMQKVIFENNINEALELLDGGELTVRNFGKVNYYEIETILNWEKRFILDKVFGVRTFWALQQNEVKFNPEWQNKIYEIEKKVSEIDEYRKVSFFNHILVHKP